MRYAWDGERSCCFLLRCRSLRSRQATQQHRDLSRDVAIGTEIETGMRSIAMDRYLPWPGVGRDLTWMAEKLSTIRDGSVDRELWQAAWNKRFQKDRPVQHLKTKKL